MGRPSMLSALKHHWPEYLAESAGLMAFMVGAGAFTTLFEYPGSPVHQAIPSELLRHCGLGLLMGAVTAGILYSPWGQRSGAHINPAVTWSFHRLGKITTPDALFYTLFQFIGGVLAPLLLLWLIGEPFAHPDVRYATTRPGPLGAWVAFLAEFAISYALMLVLLLAINSERWAKKAGLAAASLIALYIAFESPLSGMSLNPARSFGSALTAGQWDGIWLYFAAPMLSMPLAAETFRWMRHSGCVSGTEGQDAAGAHSFMSGVKEGPHYPVETPG